MSVIQVADMIKGCKALIVGVGAGMGKDSGLPDFRGNEGFWNNYPPYRGKFSFTDCANPDFLIKHPNLFWGFYGSRLAMYREKHPHKGFQAIKDIARLLGQQNLFIVTSNVDGHFTKAGYSAHQIYEVHGSINHLQCYRCDTIRENDFQPEIDYDTMSCRNLPVCKVCGEVERPNILMFNDWGWLEQRSSIQGTNFLTFKQTNKQGLALIQIGCGSAVPTIRNIMQFLYMRNKDSKLIRINLDTSLSSKHYLDPQRYIDVELSAEEALLSLWNALSK